MLSRAKCPCQGVGCGGQGAVREGLWKVCDEAFDLQVVLLRQEAKVGSQCEQALEQRSRILVAALQNVIVDQPEAAGEKNSLLADKPVHRRGRIIAHHKTIFEQVLLDGRHRALYSRVIRRQKADQRQQKKTRVQFLVPIGLDKAIQLGVEPFVELLSPG